MSIKKTTLHLETDDTVDVYPKTSNDQIVSTRDFGWSYSIGWNTYTVDGVVYSREEIIPTIATWNPSMVETFSEYRTMVLRDSRGVAQGETGDRDKDYVNIEYLKSKDYSVIPYSEIPVGNSYYIIGYLQDKSYTFYKVDRGISSNSIVLRDNSGCIFCNNPSNPYHAMNLQYYNSVRINRTNIHFVNNSVNFNRSDRRLLNVFLNIRINTQYTYDSYLSFDIIRLLEDTAVGDNCVVSGVINVNNDILIVNFHLNISKSNDGSYNILVSDFTINNITSNNPYILTPSYIISVIDYNV